MQHEAVWILPPQGESEGPTFITRTAPITRRSDHLPTHRTPFTVRDTRRGKVGIAGLSCSDPPEPSPCPCKLPCGADVRVERSPACPGQSDPAIRSLTGWP